MSIHCKLFLWTSVQVNRVISTFASDEDWIYATFFAILYLLLVSLKPSYIVAEESFPFLTYRLMISQLRTVYSIIALKVCDYMSIYLNKKMLLKTDQLVSRKNSQMNR